jgi:hypothetical protein
VIRRTALLVAAAALTVLTAAGCRAQAAHQNAPAPAPATQTGTAQDGTAPVNQSDLDGIETTLSSIEADIAQDGTP